MTDLALIYGNIVREDDQIMIFKLKSEVKINLILVLVAKV